MSSKSIFENTIKKVLQRQDLSFSESYSTFKSILDEELGIAGEVSFGALFGALQTKGPTKEEILGLIKVVLDYDRQTISYEKSSELSGIVGSGKDDLKTFNISTASAIVAAAAGYKVVKNGSRSESSIAGTTDVLEHMGFNVILDPSKVLNLLERTNFTFCDASQYFPRMGKLYVGKFLFPHPLSYVLSIASGLEFRRILFGLSLSQTELVAELLQDLGMDRFMVVAGTDLRGKTLDEISNIGPTKVSDNFTGSIRTYTITPEDFGFKTHKYEAIQQGNSVSDNVSILKRALSGEIKDGAYEVVVMNAGALISVASDNLDMKEGIKKAQKAIDSGEALVKLNEVIQISNE